MVPSLTSRDPAGPDATTAAADAPEANIESVEAEMRLAEEHYENAITGLEQIAQIAAIDDQLLDPDITATLRKNLGVIDQAIAESRAGRASQLSGPGEPVRRDVAQGLAATRHNRPGQRDAQGTQGKRERRGADRGGHQPALTDT